MTVSHSCMSKAWSLLLEVYSYNKHQQPNPAATYSAKSPLVLVGAVPKGVSQHWVRYRQKVVSFSSQHMWVPHLAHLWQLCLYH